MVLYIAIILGLVALAVFCALGKVLPKNIDKEDIKFYKMSQIITILIVICAFIVFIIAEISDAIYVAFNIIGVVLLGVAVIYYYFRNYQYKHLKRK